MNKIHRDFLNHRGECGGDRTSHAAGRGEKLYFFCLPVTLLDVKCMLTVSPVSRLNTETVLMSLDEGRFVLVNSCSILSLCR